MGSDNCYKHGIRHDEWKGCPKCNAERAIGEKMSRYMKESRSTFCHICKQKVNPTMDGKCPNDGTHIYPYYDPSR